MIKETVYTFIDAINAHDVSKLAGLLADDHVFVEPSGKETKGKEQLTAGWGDYFNFFPDYHIEISQVFTDGDTVAVLGFEGGSCKGDKEHHWRVPASWKVVVQAGKIKIWQVYADTKASDETMAKKDGVKHADRSPRVTGVGGVFFKCKDSKNVIAWYKEHLHLDTNPYGAKFDWRQGGDADKYGCTQWSPFGEKTTYFAPSAKDFMINYRVNNIEGLVAELKKNGVTVLDAIEDSDYGKFVHILDCEDNKVELWEAKDVAYDKVVGVK